MSGPATARRPSPADLAARATRTRQARATSPVPAGAEHWIRQPGDAPFRALWETGIRTSRSMHRHHRLVAYTLAAHADWETGRIPVGGQPYLDGLTRETRLRVPQVAAALASLTGRGWIAHHGPAPYETTPLTLCVRVLLVPHLARLTRLTRTGPAPATPQNGHP
jgi:hypothetical protein